MEDDDSRPPSPVRPDLAAADVLTRTNSDASSSVTVDSPNDFICRNTNCAWTDEKHNSYLASLEASFVKQLHHSLGLLCRRSDQNKLDPSPSQQPPVNACNLSDQFTVVQDGFWQKINFEKIQPLHYSAVGSHDVKERAWIHHFGRSGEHSTVLSADLPECSTFCNMGMVSRGKTIFSHHHQDAIDYIAEVWDQNFVDEEQEEKSSSLPKGKRLKMAAADASTMDQIVPARNLCSADISIAANNLSERRAGASQCLSENIGCFICPGPDVKSFLKRAEM